MELQWVYCRKLQTASVSKIAKMKTSLIVIALLLASIASFSQVNHPVLDLNTDPVFINVITHRIQYPAQPARRAVYGRYYAGFTIDQAGRIRNIAVLYPKMSRQTSKLYGFEGEILAGLKHMPPLNPNLAGDYLLPVAFCFIHYSEGPTPIIPTNVLPFGYAVGDRILLDETKVFASSPSSSRGLNGFPPSRQIGQ